MSTTPGGADWVQGPDGRWYPPNPAGAQPPAQPHEQPTAQQWWGGQPHGQQPHGQQPHGQQPYSQQPYSQQPHSQQPHSEQPHGQAPYGSGAYAPQPYGATSYGAPPYGSAAYGQRPYGANPYGSGAHGQQPPNPPAPPYPPTYGAPGLPPPGGPPRKSNAGKIVAIVVGVVVVVFILAGVAIYSLVASIGGAVVGDSGTGCTAVTAADVNAALGGTYDLVQLDGLAGGVTAPVLDSRVLADAEVNCWAVESGASDTGGRLARIARHEGADAVQRFTEERTRAMGTTEDRGGGISVSTDEYFNKDVPAGDQAFCTSGDFLGSAGALVRRGNVLIYVSTTAAGQGAGTVPDIEIPTDPSPNAGITFGTDDANCDLAVALATKAS